MKKLVRNDTYACRHLDWDTDYFGVACGKVDLFQQIEAADKKEIERFIMKETFITITTYSDNQISSKYIGKELKAFLTDVNVQFMKNVLSSPILPVNIQEKITLYNHKSYCQSLVDLANSAFQYSRFLNDINVTRQQACGVYANWIKNSFNKASKFFLIAEIDNEIAGMILFSEKSKGELVIELFCVSGNHRRKGIGTRLLQQLDIYAKENSYIDIYVGTQVENYAAMNFYSACGYKIANIRYVYHLWRMENGES